MLRKIKLIARRKLKLFVLISAVLCCVYYFLSFSVSCTDPTNYFQYYFTESIDVVYTWVNGSDPLFIESIEKIDKHFDATRYDDKNELRFSLRSLQKYAPWIRRIFIVTNGQIPHWLNMDHPKIEVVPHEDLAEDPNLLPTFSSAAIETFIHRIPGLSKRFLYLNDDIFLGSEIYPDDLYTNANGVTIFPSWYVPDCATDCPWVYIGDGSCDQHCNIDDCQYDGGDCIEDDHSSPEPLIPFQDLMKQNITNIKMAVDNFNNRHQKLRQRFRPKNNVSAGAKSEVRHSRDSFGQSLIHTNKVFNEAYGFKSRHVIAHVGFFLDTNIIEGMLGKFKWEFERTRRNRLRSSTDMQFAFSYYHYLMSETYNVTIGEIFTEFDTDKSNTWSDREIRTLLSKIYPLPLDWATVQYFEDIITNCSRNFDAERDKEIYRPTMLYERYEDSTIPPVTRTLVQHCDELVNMLQMHFSQRPKYKYQMQSKSSISSNFKMLTSNVSQVIDALDEVRRTPKKFNCINDDLETNSRSDYEDNIQLIRSLLEDFYLSLFPFPSDYELPEHYRNRFLYMIEYRHWKMKKICLRYFIWLVFFGILVILFKIWSISKTKRPWFNLRRLIEI